LKRPDTWPFQLCYWPLSSVSRQLEVLGEMKMMKLHKTYPIWLSLTALIMAILACGPTPVQPVATQVPSAQPTPISQNPGPTQQAPVPPTPTIDLPAMIKATVQIFGLFNVNGKLKPGYSGSGTLISPTGMILTNARIASPASWGEPDMEPDKLAIGLINKEDQPPVFLYYAVVKAVDGTMDLAVIQITSTLDGTNVDPSSLNLPYVQMGNSDNLFVGEHINIFGYPGIGGDTIIYSDGQVAGFVAEEGLPDRAWIKTDANISGGNYGGLAADDAGAIIGVPSIVTSSATAYPLDCRKVLDTNGDGVIDENNTCIQTDFLSSIRPVNFALTLIKAVETGQTYVSPYDAPLSSP
jgi:S1-C subfamily serine protease